MTEEPLFSPPPDTLREPRDRVYAALPGPDEAALAVKALQAAGVPRDTIYVLYGEEGVERLDPTGKHHGLRGRLIRAAQVVLAAGDAIAVAAEHIEYGGAFITVPAASREEASRVARILKSHGGTNLRYFAATTVTELS